MGWICQLIVTEVHMFPLLSAINPTETLVYIPLHQHSCVVDYSKAVKRNS